MKQNPTFFGIDKINAIKDKLFFDAEYQRDYIVKNKHVWQRGLITSIFDGLVLPFVYLREVGDGIWEVVDGQQRLRTIIDFVAGLILSPGYHYEGGKLIGPQSFGNEPYDKLRAEHYEWFEKTFSQYQLPVVEMVCSDHEASAQFKRLNNLNDMKYQELRGCERSDLAAFVRSAGRGVVSRGYDYTSIVHPVFEVDNKGKGVYLNFSSARQAYDEVLVQCLTYEDDHSNGFSQPIYDELYINSKLPGKYKIKNTMIMGLKSEINGISPTKPLGKIVLNNLNTILKLLKTNDFRKFMKRSVFFNIYMLVSDFKKSNVTIKNHTKFLKWFMDIHKEKTKLTAKHKALGLDKSPYTIALKGTTYDRLINRKSYFLNPLIDDSDAAGVIFKDPKRVVTDIELYGRWRDVDEKCEACEKLLLFGDAIKGHDIPHSYGIKKGGVTTINNLRCVCESCNDDMGDKTFDEYMKKKK